MKQRERQINQMAEEYAFTTPSTIVEAFEAGAKWADKTFAEKLKAELNNRLKNYGHPYGSTAEQRILWRRGWDMCIKNIENFIEDFLNNE